MLNRHRSVPGFALAAALLLGACTEIPTHPIDDEGSDRGREAPQASLYSESRADAYSQLSEAVPGYGGHYFDENAELVLWLKDSRMTEAEAIGALSGRMEVLGIGGDFSIQRARTAPAQWTFAELSEMQSRLNPVLGLTGSIFTDADEAINRVTIAVENASDINHVSQAVAMAGVPAAAVNYRVMEPIIPTQTLQDRVRPVAGGLQINFPGFLCTLGTPIRESNGTLGWITNSHCTSSQWNMVNTPYGQPLNTAPGNPNFIGFEVADPPGFAGGICPAGRVCRYSDASKGHFSGGQIILPGEVAFGRIYRTLALNDGTGVNGRTIDGANPMFNIVAERPFSNVGQTIQKVGRTTGWSSGIVSHSCVTTNVGNSNFTLFCQDIVQRPGVTIVAGGDSGSSVWDLAPGGGPNDVRIHGLLWGSGGSSLFVFSAMAEIRFDHGNPTWTTH